MAHPIIPIRDSSQAFTEIEAIDHDMVLFADGSVSLIIETTAVNFGLLSESEQETIMKSYAEFLNSLSFPVQILIRTQHKDVTAYLKLLEDAEAKQKNPKLAKNIASYRRFISATVKEKDVLDKKFYIILPFSRLELGVSAGVLFGGKKTGLPHPKAYIFERAATVLLPKRDHLIRLLSRIGLRAAQLTSDQIAKLFFTIYNQGGPLPETLWTSKTS